MDAVASLVSERAKQISSILESHRARIASYEENLQKLRAECHAGEMELALIRSFLRSYTG